MKNTQIIVFIQAFVISCFLVIFAFNQDHRQLAKKILMKQDNICSVEGVQQPNAYCVSFEDAQIISSLIK